MKKVCIVGVGLIGGSLGMALRRVRRGGRRAYQVLGLGRSQAALRRAKKLGALDSFSTQAKDVSSADIVVLAVPVNWTIKVAKKVRPFMKPGAILTDAGSVKNEIVKRLRGPLFVGGHPIAGSEKAGVQNARRDLFKGAICALTRDSSSKKSLSVVSAMWRDTGARVVIAGAAEHDQILALTSHLPHLIAFGLFSMVSDFSKKRTLANVLRGPSINEMTRVAASHPDVWTGILHMNRRQLSSGVKNFTRILNSILRMPPKRLHKTLSVLSQVKRAQ